MDGIRERLTLTGTAPAVYDVIVVGAGIMGSCTAYHLSKTSPGMKVLLLEQVSWNTGGREYCYIVH